MNAKKFAEDWIKSWNSHDMNGILSHYSDDLVITTPMIKMALGMDNGSLKGKVAVAEYWQKALDKIPDLHFDLFDYTVGVDSITLYYKSVMDKKAMEVMFFNTEGKVNKMIAHYSE